jgi:hypothetical protein
MVGNAINIAGQGFYFITSYTNASNVVVDRALGTFSGASWRLGGGWSDFVTNTTSAGPLVPGNIIYILGGAAPSYASPDYAVSYFTPVSGAPDLGLIQFVGDPNTPISNGYGGLPLINSTYGIIFYQSQYYAVRNLYIFAGSTTGGGIVQSYVGPAFITGVVYDENGWDQSLTGLTGPCHVINCEIFSSIPARAGYTFPGINCGPYGTRIINCNIHNCLGVGVVLTWIGSIHNSIIAKNGGSGIVFQGDGSTGWLTAVFNCTIDGNGGHGIEIGVGNSNNQSLLAQTAIVGNIISNHTGVSKAGIAVTTNLAVQNDLCKAMVDFNSFYNNAVNCSGISAGAHDVALPSDPYVAQSTQNYKLK